MFKDDINEGTCKHYYSNKYDDNEQNVYCSFI